MSDFEDSFFDTAATALTAHVPTNISNDAARTGESWTQHVNFAVACAVSNANRLRNNAAGVATHYHSGSPSADCSVKVDLVVKGNNGQAGPCGRIDTAASTLYRAVFANNAGWQLFKTVSGTNTQLGSTDASDGTTLTANSVWNLELRMAGTTISLYVNGVVRISVTDASIAGPGKSGVRNNSATTDTGGYHLDNFQSIDASSVTPISASDTVTFSDNSSLSATYSPTDSATLTDSSSEATSYSLVDAATLNDVSTLAAFLSATDAATLFDEQAVIQTAGNPAGSDSATLSEASSLVVTLSASDTILLTDVSALLAVLSRSDAGSMVDVSSLLAALALGDTVVFTDASAVSVSIDGTDFAVVGELVSGRWIATEDGFLLSESAVADNLSAIGVYVVLRGGRAAGISGRRAETLTGGRNE